MAEKPSPPIGQPLLPDLPNWAWHEYGMHVGFWRVLGVLAQRNLRASFAVNGSVCAKYPAVCQAALDAGRDFMGHGFVQRPMHRMDDQRAAIAARVHGRPGREVRPRSITVDMHSHVMVPEAAALTRTAVRTWWTWPCAWPTWTRPASTLQVVMPPPPQCTYAVPLDIGIEAARIVNAGLASLAAQKPERCAAIGTVPMQDGQAAGVVPRARLSRAIARFCPAALCTPTTMRTSVPASASLEPGQPHVVHDPKNSTVSQVKETWHLHAAYN